MGINLDNHQKFICLNARIDGHVRSETPYASLAHFWYYRLKGQKIRQLLGQICSKIIEIASCLYFTRFYRMRKEKII